MLLFTPILTGVEILPGAILRVGDHFFSCWQHRQIPVKFPSIVPIWPHEESTQTTCPTSKLLKFKSEPNRGGRWWIAPAVVRLASPKFSSEIFSHIDGLWYPARLGRDEVFIHSFKMYLTQSTVHISGMSIQGYPSPLGVFLSIKHRVSWHPSINSTNCHAKSWTIFLRTKARPQKFPF